MKYFLFVSVMCLVSMMVGAKTLIFTLANDTKVYYVLDAPSDGLRYAPVLKFSLGKVTVNGDNYEWSGIKDFRLSDENDPAGILPHSICVASDAPVVIYSVDGKKVGEAESYVSFQKLELSSLPKGVYVVEVEGKGNDKVSFKVAKK